MNCLLGVSPLNTGCNSRRPHGNAARVGGVVPPCCQSGCDLDHPHELGSPLNCLASPLTRRFSMASRFSRAFISCLAFVRPETEIGPVAPATDGCNQVPGLLLRPPPKNLVRTPRGLRCLMVSRTSWELVGAGFRGLQAGSAEAQCRTCRTDSNTTSSGPSRLPTARCWGSRHRRCSRSQRRFDAASMKGLRSICIFVLRLRVPMLFDDRPPIYGPPGPPPPVGNARLGGRCSTGRPRPGIRLPSHVLDAPKVTPLLLRVFASSLLCAERFSLRAAWRPRLKNLVLARLDVEDHAAPIHDRLGHDTIGGHPGVRLGPGKRDLRGTSRREPQAHPELLGVPGPLDAYRSPRRGDLAGGPGQVRRTCR